MNNIARYQENQNNSLNSLVDKHAGLVKRIAQHLLSRLPANVMLDDLVQSGMIGLMEAANNFDETKGASFETYAGIRIRGTMLDDLRKLDWTPRSVHRNSRKISQAIHVIENRTGRDAKDNEIAIELGVSLDDYNHMLKDTCCSKVFAYEDMGLENEQYIDNCTENKDNTFEKIEKFDIKKKLAKSIDTLPEKEKLVIALYYDEELNLKEIGKVLGVSESRISQIHSQAILRLKTKVNDWD